MPETEILAEKNAWRNLARELFALTPREARAELDAALCRRLPRFLEDGLLPVAGHGRHPVLLAYAALPDEADATAFLREWVAGGGLAALPVWAGGRTMSFREVRDWDRDLAPGRGGIMEPSEKCPEVPAEQIACVLVPGRFFSEKCERLGRGAGCYDSFPSESKALKLGIAYDFQIVPSLPSAAHDVPVDAVLTPTRTIRKAEE